MCHLCKSLPLLRLRCPPPREHGVGGGGLSEAIVILSDSLGSGDLLWLPKTPHDSFSFPRYLNNQVFVSLANGELVVYQREAGECPPPTVPLPTLSRISLLSKPGPPDHKSGDVTLGNSQVFSGVWCPH